MLFPTYQFLIFFAIVFSWAISLKRKVTRYKLFLLGVSLIFYSFWSWQFLGLLVVNVIVNYGFIRAIYAENQHKILKIGLLFNLIYLGIFKYFNFFIDSLLEGLNALQIPTNIQILQMSVPAGVSFYTFRSISHLVDSYYQKIPCPTLIDYATYITYFPQIAAGPISRAKEFYQQLNTPNKYNYEIEEVVVLILSGLFKKYTLASFLFNFTQLPFRNPEQYSSLDLILAAVAYSGLIYVDFSGYSDLANGISCLLGFKPILNFNRPYSSLSLQEFWRRWHISLSEWLRDYLYIPLGGNRGGQFRKLLNLFLTMGLGGLWHGAGLNFIIWGMLHGVGLVTNHLWQDGAKIIQVRPQNLVKVLSPGLNWLLTFSFITFTWIFFQTPDVETAITFLQGIFQSETTTHQLNYWQLYAVISMIGVMNFCGDPITRFLYRILAIRNLFFQVSLVSAFLYVILMLGPSTVPPFIYFSF